MNNEIRYELTEGILTIFDSAMHIAFEAPFTPVMLPDNPQEGGEIAIKRDAQGFMREAWLEKDGVREGQWRRYDREGHVIGEGYYLQGKMHGPMVFRSSEGALLAETWFIQGKRQGRSYYFYPNKKIYASLKYLDGEKHGSQEYFYPDGRPKAILYYAEGKVNHTPTWYPES